MKGFFGLFHKKKKSTRKKKRTKRSTRSTSRHSRRKRSTIKKTKKRARAPSRKRRHTKTRVRKVSQSKRTKHTPVKRVTSIKKQIIKKPTTKPVKDVEKVKQAGINMAAITSSIRSNSKKTANKKQAVVFKMKQNQKKDEQKTQIAPKKSTLQSKKVVIKVEKKKVFKQQKKKKKRHVRAQHRKSQKKVRATVKVRQYGTTQQKLYSTIHQVFSALRKKRRFVQHDLDQTHKALARAMNTMKAQSNNEEEKLQKEIRKIKDQYHTAHMSYHNLLQNIGALQHKLQTWKGEEMRAHEAIRLLDHTALTKSRRSRSKRHHRRSQDLGAFFQDMKRLQKHAKIFGSHTGERIEHTNSEQPALRQFMKKIDTILGKLPKKEIEKFSKSKDFAFYKRMMEKYSIR